MMKQTRRFLGLLMGAMLGMASGTSPQADIMISPVYIIMDERDRSADVMLINTTNKMNVYRMSWSYSQQMEDGRYEPRPRDPDAPLDFDTMVRFAPKQVTLPPNGRQKVRLQLQRPANLPDGEYRGHLNFKLLPKDEPAKPGQPSGMSMEIKVIMGIAMPVVVRQGEYDAQAKIVNVKFAKEKPSDPDSTLRVRVERTGKHGTYGRLRVFWDKPDGDSLQIGTLNNFSIYGDNSARVGHVRLTETAIPAGKLRIVYEADGPQRGQIFAERSVNIGR